MGKMILTDADVQFVLAVLAARVLLTVLIVLAAFTLHPHYLLVLGALWLTWRVKLYDPTLGWV